VRDGKGLKKEKKRGEMGRSGGVNGGKGRRGRERLLSAACGRLSNYGEGAIREVTGESKERPIYDHCLWKEKKLRKREDQSLQKV